MIPALPGRPPAITADQMREVDRVTVEDLGIGLMQMMENAGRMLALLAVARYAPSSVSVLAGSGGNGGGGLVAARHLANRGASVTVTPTRPLDSLAPVTSHQAAILARMGVPFADPPADAGLVIDALIGYSLSGDPRGREAALIGWANASGSLVLALDGPSGLDLTTGRAGEPCIRADATLTLALPKAGLYQAPELVGALFLADIGVPPAVYRRFGIDLEDPFTSGPVVRLP